MKLLCRLSAASNVWVEKSLAALGVTMACVVLAQVFCRYVLNHSLFWSEELARYLLVWLTFLGASSAYYRKVHPGIDILTQRLHNSLKKGCRICVHIISMCFFAIIIYYGIAFAYFLRSQITPALALPKWLIFSVIPISGVLFLLHGTAFFLTEMRERHDGD